MRGPKSTDLKGTEGAGTVDGSGCRRVAATGVTALRTAGAKGRHGEGPSWRKVS